MKLKNRKISLIALSFMGAVLLTSVESVDAAKSTGTTFDQKIKNRPGALVGNADYLRHCQGCDRWMRMKVKCRSAAMCAMCKACGGVAAEKKNEFIMQREHFRKFLDTARKVQPNELITVRKALEKLEGTSA